MWTKYGLNLKKKSRKQLIINIYETLISGVEGSRTPVQTSRPLAFYMLIFLLIVGTKQERNQPT